MKMADPNWRTDPDIQLAKQVAVHKQAAAAIVIWFKDGGQFGAASYGRDGEICKAAGKVVDAIMDRIENHNDADPLTEILA